MTPAAKDQLRIVGAVIIPAIIFFASWVFYRAGTLGINNVFSREHVFTDARPLTEQVAIELTMETLKADGRDMSAFAPVEYSPIKPN
jgi:hypothetical protein